jgi:hypothetical protein
MADDRRNGREDEEPKITVRDRRRVDLTGELREVEADEPEPTAPSEIIVKGKLADAPPPPPPPPAQEAAPPPRPRRGGALGGAEDARVNRGPLRDADAMAEDLPEGLEPGDDEGEGGERRQINNVYEYVQVLAGEMNIWSLSAMGLMANPMTGLVTTDMHQAAFAVEVADALIDTLAGADKIDVETIMALCQNMVVNYGSVAAQLLNQPPQTRLQELSKVRFCIDTAEMFSRKLQALVEADGSDEEAARLAEIQRFLSELRLAFVQSSGGGGVVG